MIRVAVCSSDDLASLINYGLRRALTHIMQAVSTFKLLTHLNKFAFCSYSSEQEMLVA